MSSPPPRPDDPNDKKKGDSNAALTPGGKPPTPKTPSAHTANNPRPQRTPFAGNRDGPQTPPPRPVTSIHGPVVVDSPSDDSPQRVERVTPMEGPAVEPTDLQRRTIRNVGSNSDEQRFRHMGGVSQRRREEELRRLGRQVRFGQLPQNNEPQAGAGLRRSPSALEARERVDRELNSVTGVEQQIVELQEEIQSIDIELHGLYQQAADLTLLEGSQHTGSLLMNPVRINRLHNIQNQINGLVTHSNELRQLISELRRGGMSRHQQCEFRRERREYNNTTLKF